MHIVSRVLGGVGLQEGGLPARMAAKMAALPGGAGNPGERGLKRWIASGPYRNNASANIAFNCSRNPVTSASVASSLASSSCGSPRSSSWVCGFLMSRL